MSVGQLWPSLRGLLIGHFSFYEIKALCAESGLAVSRLSHLQQRAGSSTSKGQLLDGLDSLVEELDPAARDRFVANCIEDVLVRAPDSRERLEEVLQRVGWGIIGGTPYPLELSVDVGLSELPESIQRGLEQALKRYRDGDAAGALTSICGMIDNMTRRTFEEDSSLGIFGNASYQERVAKAFRALEERYKGPLIAAGMDGSEVDRVWRNHSKAISQAGYVLGSVRRNFADVHGWTSAPPTLVQQALDSAAFFLRGFAGLGSV